MSRNLVLCFDGTNNQFGLENTNVVRLLQVLERNPDKQRLYYDPGVGTLPEKLSAHVAGLAFGGGLMTDVLEAYTYLMQEWERGDDVFLVGFSRGSYTARVLAGMLHRFGLMPRGAHNLLPYIERYYRSLSKDHRAPTTGITELEKICAEFRRTFARTVTGPDDREKYFPIHFMGIWDTVSSVGWVWDPVTFRNTARNPSVRFIRHAIAVDERRAFFRQNRMEPAVPGQDVIEYWFPGVHSDVGGGYPEADGGLWRIPFEWIVTEAEKAGLYVDPKRKEEVLHRSPVPQSPWGEPQHESLTPSWRIAEYFPKLRKTKDPITGCWSTSPWPKLNQGARRTISPGARIHKATLLRLRETSVKQADGVYRYDPPNLSPEFRAHVRSLAEVPEYLAYDQDPKASGGPSPSPAPELAAVAQ